MLRILFLAALAAAFVGFGGLEPAAAGGHEWWRSCGGHTYEGCDGVPRGPYAHGHRGAGHADFGRGTRGGYYVPPQVHGGSWHRRTIIRCYGGRCIPLSVEETWSRW